MKKGILTAVFALIWLAGMVAGLFFTLRATIISSAYFAKTYEKLDIEKSTAISVEDCTRAIYRLVEYMEGDAESIQLQVKENGTTVAMYNRQEIEHMVDVRALYQSFRMFSLLSIGAFVLMLALCLWKKQLIPCLRRAFSRSWIVLGALVLVLGLWVLIDFNSFWTGFHYLFFDNTLWLMDPAVCRMIRICPIELFYGIVVRTGLIFILLFGIAPPAIFALRKRHRGHKSDKPEESV